MYTVFKIENRLAITIVFAHANPAFDNTRYATWLLPCLLRNSYIKLSFYRRNCWTIIYTSHFLQLDSYPEKAETGWCDEVFIGPYFFMFICAKANYKTTQ